MVLPHIHNRREQKKMTDFFPPSPKFIEHNVTSEHNSVDLENQPPPSKCKAKMSQQRYSLRPKKMQPRLFYGFEPKIENIVTVKAKNIKIKKDIVLKENSSNIIVQTKEHVPLNIDKITLIKSNTIVNNNSDNENSPIKSVIALVYKPQRNARRIYLKYGTRVPSFNDIRKSREELIKFKEDVAYVAELQKDSVLNNKSVVKLEFEDSEEMFERLDCKHIPLRKLKYLFKNYQDFVIGIGNGTIPSDRHRIYMQNSSGLSEVHLPDLTFNISMSPFTTKQNVLLAKLTKKTLCKHKLMYNNQYYFKVVLPELCFKIFMQEHKLTEDEATKYLTNPQLS